MYPVFPHSELGRNEDNEVLQFEKWIARVKVYLILVIYVTFIVSWIWCFRIKMCATEVFTILIFLRSF